MIFRITGKMAKKVKVKPTEVFPKNINPLGDWSMNLFLVGRTQFILVSNTATLYSVLLPGKGITDQKSLENRVFQRLNDHLASEDLAEVWHQHMEPMVDHVTYSKALNRAVTGCMNDQIFTAKVMFARGSSNEEVHHVLNINPLSYLDYISPGVLFRELV